MLTKAGDSISCSGALWGRSSTCGGLPGRHLCTPKPAVALGGHRSQRAAAHKCRRFSTDWTSST